MSSRFRLFWQSLILMAMALPPIETAADSHSPVVVELFESQGCSSCPPAERLLANLQNRWHEAIIPMVYHVDYWDHPWKDTFSDPRNTERQRRYAQAFGDSSLYTPEMVLQGEVGFVGSDGIFAQSEIPKRLEQTGPSFVLTCQKTSPTTAILRFALLSNWTAKVREVTVVIVEDAPSVRVQRGENSGEVMSGYCAVRTFWTLQASGRENYAIPLALDPAWNLKKSRVIVLLRGSASKILAAAESSFY